MCGRYSLAVPASYVRHQLQQQGQRVDDAPDDDGFRESYNFAPGQFGVVYRADTSCREEQAHTESHDTEQPEEQDTSTVADNEEREQRYILQPMKWGLIPFWTKRNPDYGSLMKTINCREDSLVENRGMWTTMKKRKRCVVVCQGFYEWLKKGPGGKERVPHFVRKKDGGLMFFAGLWDCVQYEGSDEKLYTYTVITTSSNAQLRFLHDRMPAILEPGSAEMAMWLDPKRTTWTKELQSVLKPYEGELDCYPVSKEVGNVRNNSPDFIIPINSKENKNNIANFFAKGKKEGAKPPSKDRFKIEKEQQDKAQASKEKAGTDEPSVTGIKRKLSPENNGGEDSKPPKVPKTEQSSTSPGKGIGGRKMHSATSNSTSPAKATGKKNAAQGTQKITSFFKK